MNKFYSDNGIVTANLGIAEYFRSYSYYIEVSMDELDWVRVVDHSKFLCRSWQNLFFTPRVCR